MNVEEQVATLEALLARVKKNAAMPRALHRADVGATQARAPLAAGSAGEPAAEPVGVKPAPAEIAPKPVEITPRPAPVEIAVKPAEPLADKPHKGLTTTLVGTPGTTKAAPEPVAARSAVVKPVEKVEPVKSAVTAPAARVPVPAVTKPVAPKPADAGTPRTPPVSPTRPAATRAPFPSRPAIEPAEKAEPAKVEPAKVEPAKVEPARTPEPAKVEPVRAAAPVEKVEAAPIKPAEKPVSTLKAPDENELLFNFDTEPETTAKRPEPAAVKPVEKAPEKAAVKPVEKAPEKPVQKAPEKRAELRPTPFREEEEATDDETKLMVGPIPDAARPPPADEITVDDDTRIVNALELTKAADKQGPVAAVPAAVADESEEPESEEVTRLMEPGERISMPKLDGDRGSAPKIEATPPAKPVAERPALPKIEGEKVVVSEAVRPQVKVEEAPAPAYEAAPALPIVAPIPSALIEDHPPELREATSPSRRFEPPQADALPAAKPGGRAPLWGLAIAATLLLGAGALVGLRNGWFDSGNAPGPGPSGALPPTSALPVLKESATPGTTTAPAAITVPEPASAAPSASAALSAPPIESAVPSASASAGPATSASAPPAASASAEPAVKPPPDGDGSALAPNKGYLIVTSAKPAGVFLTGVFVGLTGDKIEVECGAKFLRLGVAPADGAARPAEVTWISEGKSAAVGCMKTTKITLEAK